MEGYTIIYFVNIWRIVFYVYIKYIIHKLYHAHYLYQPK